MASAKGSGKAAKQRQGENQAGGAKSLYGRRIVSSLGATKREPVSRWRPGRAGTTSSGIRFVVYGGHIRADGERSWRTNNPGNIRMGPFARANSAIGHDGNYAIFPNELTGARALINLLHTTSYARMTVREALLRHASDLEGDIEARARAKQFGLNVESLIGSLSDKKLVDLGNAIGSSLNRRRPRIYKKSSTSKASWARAVLASADAQGLTSAATANYFGYPATWQVGVWYVRQGDGTYLVSPDQSPRAGAVGVYVRYDGNNRWSIVGRGSTDTGTSNSPIDPTNPDAGEATPPGQAPPDLYTVVVTRDDGTTYTVVVAPPGSALNVPPNAEVIANTDGTFLILYNNDGSSWDFSGDSGGNTGGAGARGNGDGSTNGPGAEGGDTGDGGTSEGDGGAPEPEPDPESTGVPWTRD